MSTGARLAAGAEAVLADGWAPPAVGDMAQGPEAAGIDISETPTVVVLCDKTLAEVQKSIVPARRELQLLQQSAGTDARSEVRKLLH